MKTSQVVRLVRAKSELVMWCGMIEDDHVVVRSRCDLTVIAGSYEVSVGRYPSLFLRPWISCRCCWLRLISV
jgi:hypothetical protein